MKVRNDRKTYCTQYGVVIDVSHAPMLKFLFKVFRTLVILIWHVICIMHLQNVFMKKKKKKKKKKR